MTQKIALENNLKTSLILSIWVNLLFTILKESTPALKSGIKLMDNHWVGHTIYMVIFFFTIVILFQILKLKINLNHHFTMLLQISFSITLIAFTVFYLIHNHAFD